MSITNYICLSCHFFNALIYLAISTDDQVLTQSSRTATTAKSARAETALYSLVMLVAMGCNLLIAWALLQGDREEDQEDLEHSNHQEYAKSIDHHVI